MFEDFMTKMAVWENGLESKGSKVNMGQSYDLSCDLHKLQTFGKYPCAVSMWERC